MFAKPSLVARIAIGKLVGLAVGVIGFFSLPWFLPDAGPMLRWGIVFWYTTLGAIIGVLGVAHRQPSLRLPLPWFVRAPLVGAWMNFVLVFFAHEKMRAMLIHMFGDGSVLTSPFWLALEGAVAGWVIGYLAMRFIGEGTDTIDEPAG